MVVMKNVLSSNFIFSSYFFISACMKMSAEDEKEDVKFNALSKCELLASDWCLERRIFVVKSVAENECVSVAITKVYFLHSNPF